MVPRPFPSTTSRSLPSAITADGYQPTGILPLRVLLPVAVWDFEVYGERSNTPTALLSASATKSRVPSAETASALGVLPSGVPAGEASSSVAITEWVIVSRTVILSVLPDATKSREPAALSASAEG